jgi:hypothetical protein
MTIQQLMELNNQGVRFLEQENTSAAIALFQQGIAHLDEDTLSSFDRIIASGPKTRIHANNAIASLCDESIFVFNKAIVLDTEQEGNNGDNVKGSLLYVAVLVFNFALALHLKGKLAGQAKLFRKASKLYGSVLEMILQDRHQDDRYRYLAILALNNQAQIHHEYFSDYSVSRNLFQSLSNELVNHGIVNGLGADEYQFLLQNTISFRSPQTAQAA